MSMPENTTKEKVIPVNIKMLQELQDSFCKANDVYIYCVMKYQGQLTSFSGSQEEEEYVDSHFTSQIRQALMNSFIDGTAENIVEVDSTENYFLYRGVAIRDKSGVFYGAFLCFGIAAEHLRDDVYIPSSLRRTSLAAMDNAMGLLDILSGFTFSQKLDMVGLEEKLNEQSEATKQMLYQLKKNEIMTEILGQMEKEGAFVELAKKILSLAGDYLKCSNSMLLQLKADTDEVEVISRSNGENKGIIFTAGSVGKAALPFFNGKPYTISSRSSLPADFKTFFDRYGIKAGIFLPVDVNGASEMYLAFITEEEACTWNQEDIRFAGDVKTVLQTMLLKRITHNSLASSYTTITSILQNAGYGVAVTDIVSKSILFANTTFNDMFSDEVDHRAVDEFLFTQTDGEAEVREFAAKGSAKWFNVSLTSMKWVDDRQVQLFTFYDITQLKEYQHKVEKAVKEDSLTGLFNRQTFEKDLLDQYRQAVTTGNEFAVLMIDLDDFSFINEGLGHNNGDEMLKYIAHLLNSIPVISDKCYRAGGDEFTIIVDSKAYSQLDYIIARVIALFENPWILDDMEYYCTMSMGVVKVPENAPDYASILSHLNLALAKAKSNGKNRVEYYSDAYDLYAAEKLKMEAAMRRAVDEGCKEFEVYFQPIMEMRHNSCICHGAEALVRWNSPELGMVAPDDFIALAEYLGLIIPIGAHVLDEAARACKYWNDFGHPDYKVNVNLSVVQFTSSDIVATVEKTLQTTGLVPQNLVLEVTESLAIGDMERMVDLLSKLRALGCKIALDDFGTGYSSLNHIRSMPVDTIKIDRAFVQDTGHDQFSQVFIKSVSALADCLKMNVCVEGVEEESQHDMLHDLSVEYVQGFLFDRPMPRDDFENKYVTV